MTWPGVMRPLLGSLVATLLVSTSGFANQPNAPGTSATRQLAGLRISVPKGAEVTTRQLGEKVDVVAITRGSEVLLLTVYRTRISAKRALETTVEELTQQVRKTATPNSIRIKSSRIRMLKRLRAAKKLDYAFKVAGNDKTMQAVVVAAKVGRRVVVASWNATRREMSTAFSPQVISKMTLSKKSSSPKKTNPPSPL